jgi:deazaflavin-dependent oxidoreductase (nitroreductase family)
MKSFFRLLTAFHVWLYRLSGGKLAGRIGDLEFLLLTTIGRRTGKNRTIPLGWIDHEEGFLIVASNSGGPSNPGWFHNLKGNPEVTVEVMDRVLGATAEVLSGEARTQAWRQVLAAAPLYARYERRTTREIPLILLRPGK